jgi:hypothetical protein
VANRVYSVLQSKRPLPRSLRALIQWTQGKEMEMIEKRQNKADCSGVCRCQITTYDKKSWKSHGGIDGCRNFKNLYLSLPYARPVLVKVDLLQADVGATKWVAPSGLPTIVGCGAGSGKRGAREGSGREGMRQTTERRFRFTAPLLYRSVQEIAAIADLYGWPTQSYMHTLVGAGLTDPGSLGIAMRRQGRQAGSAEAESAMGRW